MMNNIQRKKNFPVRKVCTDFQNVHKKAIYSDNKNNMFLKLEGLSILLKPLFPNHKITSDDFVCKNCFAKFSSMFRVSSNIEIIQDDSDSVLSDRECSENEYDNFPESDGLSDDCKIFVRNPEHLRECFNYDMKILDMNVSPLKSLTSMTESSKIKYVNRKRKQLVDSFSELTTTKLSKICEVPLQKIDCTACDQWIDKLKLALKNCETYSEKIRLLTIVPDIFSKTEVLSMFPEITIYMIDESRKLKIEKGVFKPRDPYLGHPMSEDDVKIVQEYFLNDDLDFSRQSPNKKDVRIVNENGIKINKVKRFLTRSMQEIYHIFREKNPNFKISKAKFYMLRPKWVMINPSQEVCLCIYCTNFELCVVALKNVKKDITSDLKILQEDLFSKIMCNSDNDLCKLGECEECPGVSGISVSSLNISEDMADDEVQFALWNKGEIEKRSTSVESFLSELAEKTVKANCHMYVKSIQQEKIRNFKNETENDQRKMILHFDFAENWKVITKNEIQSAYWKTKQVSIFTAVCYCGNFRKSFAVVSDDTNHDSSHALLAMNRIHETLKKRNNVS